MIGLLSTKTKLSSTSASKHAEPRNKPQLSLPLPSHQQHLMFALRQASLQSTRRSFSTTSRIMSQKYEWMVILPDNVGALDKRMAVREYVKSIWNPLFSVPAVLELRWRCTHTEHITNAKITDNISQPSSQTPKAVSGSSVVQCSKTHPKKARL
jgi:hypothetical protein